MGNIPVIANLLALLGQYKTYIMASIPIAAGIYCVVICLGWYTMTEDEQQSVKKKCRSAILVAIIINIVVWFLVDAESKNVVGNVRTSSLIDALLNLV